MSNDNIPTEEVKKDIQDTEQEIFILQNEIEGLEKIGDKMSMFRADGKRGQIKERTTFIAKLQSILLERETVTLTIEDAEKQLAELEAKQAAHDKADMERLDILSEVTAIDRSINEAVQHIKKLSRIQGEFIKKHDDIALPPPVDRQEYDRAKKTVDFLKSKGGKSDLDNTSNSAAE